MSNKPINEPIQIAAAALHDIPDIMTILQQNLIHNLDISANKNIEQTGFLIHAFTPEVLEVAILNPAHYMVITAQQQQETVGYIWACDYQTLSAEFQEKLSTILAEHRIPIESILYYRQIAKKVGTKGIGQALITALMQEALQRHYRYIICQIVHQPFENKASINFHEKAGFKMLTTIPNEEKLTGLYLKAIQ